MTDYKLTEEQERAVMDVVRANWHSGAGEIIDFDKFLYELKQIVAQEIQRAVEKKRGVIHAVFWCNWCGKRVLIEEVSIDEHATTGATLFSHNDNHLLELREFTKTETTEEVE